MRADMPDDIRNIFGDILKRAADGGGGIADLTRTLRVVKDLTVSDVRAFNAVQVCVLGTKDRPWLMLPSVDDFRANPQFGDATYSSFVQAARGGKIEDLTIQCEQILIPAGLVTRDPMLSLRPRDGLLAAWYKNELLVRQTALKRVSGTRQMTSHQFTPSGRYLVGLLDDQVWRKKSDQFREAVVSWMRVAANRRSDDK